MPSILAKGILSHNEAIKINHEDISMPEVQKKRANKTVPNGLKLHEYANLYFDARNPMMYKRKDQANDFCVLRVSKAVMNIPGTALSDRNASSNYARFLAPEDIKNLDFDRIFIRNWSDSENKIAHYENTSIKCAEILVPKVIPPNYIIGAYVKNEFVKTKFKNSCALSNIEINSDLFFG